MYATAPPAACRRRPMAARTLPPALVVVLVVLAVGALVVPGQAHRTDDPRSPSSLHARGVSGMNVSIAVTPQSPTTSPANITVSWAGFTSASTESVLAIFAPADSPYPIGWLNLTRCPTWASGTGHLTVPLVTLRTAYAFALYAVLPAYPGPLPAPIARTTVAQQVQFPAPLIHHLRTAVTGSPTAIRFMFTAQCVLRPPVVRIGRTPGDLGRLVVGTAFTYGLADMCEWPANDPRYWIDPGVQFDVLVDGLEPGTEYFYQVGGLADCSAAALERVVVGEEDSGDQMTKNGNGIHQTETETETESEIETETNDVSTDQFPHSHPHPHPHPHPHSHSHSHSQSHSQSHSHPHPHHHHHFNGVRRRLLETASTPIVDSDDYLHPMDGFRGLLRGPSRRPDPNQSPPAALIPTYSAIASIRLPAVPTATARTLLIAYGDLGVRLPFDAALEQQPPAEQTVHWITNLLDARNRSLDTDPTLNDRRIDPALLRIRRTIAAGSASVSALHIGDISYARGVAFVWDYFMSAIEPIARQIPYMVGIGNHEFDYSGQAWRPDWSNYGTDSGGECGVPYSMRFHMPDISPPSIADTDDSAGVDSGAAAIGVGVDPQLRNLWFSYDVGNIHVTVMSTEHDFLPASDQYLWLEADLAAVDRSRTPWLFFAGHRPMYSSEQEGDPQTFKEALRESIEPLLLNYRVNLALWGHVHMYERTCGIIGNYTCGARDEDGVVHMVIGMAGNDYQEAWNPTEPGGMHRLTPIWMPFRAADFGYVTFETTEKTLEMNYFDDQRNQVHDRLFLQLD